MATFRTVSDWSDEETAEDLTRFTAFYSAELDEFRFIVISEHGMKGAVRTKK